jgi:hypothetical protein
MMTNAPVTAVVKARVGRIVTLTYKAERSRACTATHVNHRVRTGDAR